jgi:DNA-binding beta-propeller fold protein YncE
LAGCLSASGGSQPGNPGGGANNPNPGAAPPGTQPTPPPQNSAPTPAPYVRGSIGPQYQLTPRIEYGRMNQANITMSDNDFEVQVQAGQQIGTSASQKMQEIGTLPELLGGVRSQQGGLITSADDIQRSNFIPFRGNPTDVKFISINNVSTLYIPLGGDVMTPGNEVAVVQNGAVLQRLKVGVRPQRIAIHPAGLVFVCNQYSNFMSIIDPNTNQLLTKGGKPVEIKTEYFCADLAFAPSGNAQDTDHQFLYVANRWRHSVLKYKADVVRDPLSNRPIDVIQSVGAPDPNFPNKPIAEIEAGSNPFRLTLSDQKDTIFVANNKGGEVSSINVATDKLGGHISINAPSADVVNINDLLYVPTLCPDRGFLAADDGNPQAVHTDPTTVTGIDGQQHVAHPGSLSDNTKAYNFEDLRNGLFQLDFQLQSAPQTNQVTNNVYYTDDISAEANFQAGQKVLTGALPTTIVRNAAGTKIWLANGGSDQIQELNVNTGTRPFTVTKSRVIATQHRPFGLAVNEKKNQLYVANWGQETLQVFDLATGNQVGQPLDLGYAQPAYPATNIERGEFFFYNAAWSNNQRKSCATCHFDELDTDGVGYGNGAQSSNAPHQVKPNHNLATTDSYFWNGAFNNGNYTSVAFAAQTRDNCELIELGLIEGPGFLANKRVGDPNNKVTTGAVDDQKCQPQPLGLSKLANQADIDAIKAKELQLRDNVLIPQATSIPEVTQIAQFAKGLTRDQLSSAIDFYSVAELRLPPNPTRQLFQAQQLASDVAAQISHGKDVFTQAGCNVCHNGEDPRHPYTDDANHGEDGTWVKQFIAQYQNDPRVAAILQKAFGNGALPQTFLDANSPPAFNDHAVNVYKAPFDNFIPFMFDNQNAFEFDDPLQVHQSGTAEGTEEARRLELLTTVNLADPDREFIPGNPPGVVMINTPSLKGVWTQANLLHHGLAHTVAEAILAPGHPSLKPTEFGWAVGNTGAFDVHGATSKLPDADVKALIRFVESIE